jgi:integrase
MRLSFALAKMVYRYSRTALLKIGIARSLQPACPGSASTIFATTHMLAAGVHPKVASERLGHSKIGITLDLYSHVLPNMQADAAAVVDDALRAAVNKRETKPK